MKERSKKAAKGKPLPLLCPHCGSSTVYDCLDTDDDDETARERLVCGDCGETYTAIYKKTLVEIKW